MGFQCVSMGFQCVSMDTMVKTCFDLLNLHFLLEFRQIFCAQCLCLPELYILEGSIIEIGQLLFLLHKSSFVFALEAKVEKETLMF